ncbi:MAG: hydroxymethylbilane synthase [Anaerovoracaceae bacterium]
MKRKIIVGSRESKLAVLQTQLVMDEIARNNPDIQLELVTMKTTGDVILDKTLDKIGGKGLFVKELDKALMDKRVDITIHSLKDLPMEENPKLPLLAFSERANPYDVLVLPEGEKEIDLSKPIGSSSARRVLQLEEIYGDFESKSVRGNVITRLAKLDRGEYGSLILAHAGLTRVGLGNRITKVFTHNEMIPSAGQGILVIQGRANEDYSFLESVDSAKSRAEAEAEREFVRVLDGGCSSPIGAFSMANMEDEIIEIFGLYYDEVNKVGVKGSVKGPLKDRLKLASGLAIKLKESKND